jgi:hypothetical protein
VRRLQGLALDGRKSFHDGLDIAVRPLVLGGLHVDLGCGAVHRDRELLAVEVRGADLVVSLLNGKFKATYYKPMGRPHLILRERTRTDDHEIVDEAYRAAVAKGTRAWVDCLRQAEAPVMARASSPSSNWRE